MTSILLQDFVNKLELKTQDPEERFITTGINWQQYEKLLEALGDSPNYRLTYLEGVLEIMSPSLKHERNKKQIAIFLEAYFQETLTPFWPMGSTTFRLEAKQGGTEPDECYCIGTEKDLPDLVIEVVVTSGGIDKLEVYKKLDIKEVWFWQNNQFKIYSLQGENYQQANKSQLLPNLDLQMLAEYILTPNPLMALLDFRQKIKSSLG